MAIAKIANVNLLHDIESTERPTLIFLKRMIASYLLIGELTSNTVRVTSTSDISQLFNLLHTRIRLSNIVYFYFALLLSLAKINISLNILHVQSFVQSEL